MPYPDAKVLIRSPHESDPVVDDIRLPQPGDDTWRFTRVAIADGRCIGVATLSLSSAIDSYFCEVTVAPDYRRRRIGTQLYAAVVDTIGEPFPVLARAMQSQPLRRQFADSIGCSVLIHCPEPWIDPTSTAGQLWLGAQAVPLGYRVVSMRELPFEQVGEAWARYFDWTHQPFGAVHRDRLSAVWTQLRSGVDQDLSMVSVDTSTGHITALSLVSPDVWDGRTMVIAETITKTQPAGHQLLRATLAASLRVLGQRGTQRVELEGHATDAHFPDLVRTLPPGASDPMDILLLSPPTSAGKGS